MGLRDRLLGDPDNLDRDGVMRVLRHGSTTARVAAAMRLARDGHPGLEGWLDDPVPGVRRAAARGLGWSGRHDVDRLWDAYGRERTETVRLALAGALLRCGERRAAVEAALREHDGRRLGTSSGARPASATGAPPLERLLAVEVGDVSREAGLARGRAALDAGDERPESLLPYSALSPPSLRDRLAASERSGGRRGGHVHLEALGWHGDARAGKRLVAALEATDVDPGRGFAQRRIAAVALGRLGDPAARPAIEKALEREALEFEGRPGAGLGVQFPVRNLLLWALGEIGAVEAAGTLASYLADRSGSPTGGFSLPAADALARLGQGVVPAVAPLLDRDADVAANAAGVLAALGPSDALDRARRDPRDVVREAASADGTDPDPRVAAGLGQLVGRDWFDAHEVLEDPWREATGDRRQVLQALIQGAVALEHLRRGNPRGARGQWQKATTKLVDQPWAWRGVGLGPWRRAMDAFFAGIGLEERIAAAERGEPARPLPPESSWPVPPLSLAALARIRAS